MNNEYNPFSVEMHDTAHAIDNSAEYNNLIDELSEDELSIEKASIEKSITDDLSIDEDFMDVLSIDEIPLPKTKLSLAEAHIEAQPTAEAILASVLNKPKKISLAEAHIEAQPTAEAILASVLNQPKKISLAEAHIEAQPTAESVIASVLNKPKAANEPSLLSRISTSYSALQSKLTVNQQLIQENRTKIADLRGKIRAFVADSQPADKDEEELHGNKLLVQNDSCRTLIVQAEKIRESIYDNSEHALSLLAPLKASVELLELRVQYVRTLEQLLKNIKEGLALQDRLIDIDMVVESLAKKLEVVVA